MKINCSPRILWCGTEGCFCRLRLKNNTLKATFVSPENETYYKSEKFGKVLDYVKANPRRLALRDVKGKAILQVENVQSIKALDDILTGILLTFKAFAEVV